jgi:hypothetical protein
MSKRRAGLDSAGESNARSAGEYDVGYRRPPKNTQFKSGQSGNPKGRPKGAKNEATIWRTIFNRKVAIREGGRTRNVSLLEAMLLKYTERAINGEAKAADFVLNRFGMAERTGPDTEELSQDDRQVIDNFLKRRLEANFKTKKA